MKYSVYQIRITKDQMDLINKEGFDAVPAKKAHLDMDMDFSGKKIGSLAADALDAGYYTHVANIEAADYNDCFEVGNIGPDENIERLGRMSSLSVGDVIVAEDGTVAVIAPIGFVAFSHNTKVAA